MTVNCCAGVDFSQMSNGNGDLPEFHSGAEARKWAYSVFYDETLRQKLIQKRYELRQKALMSIQYQQPKAYDQDVRLTPEQAKDKERDLLQEWERYGIALRIMEEFKRLGMRGPVGASFEAYSIPWKH